MFICELSAKQTIAEINSFVVAWHRHLHCSTFLMTKESPAADHVATSASHREIMWNVSVIKKYLINQGRVVA